MLEIGSLIDGKYKILNKVGQGGMSVVYLAMNEKANKQWAVKEVRKDGIKDFEVVKQGLVAETDILKKLSHPNLPSIIDVIDTDESFIIIMDYIQGNSLNKALEEFGAQPQADVIEWAKQLCDVLGYLHTRTPAIIYRDMKPANIMLKPDGNVTLIDFGTAREYKEKNLADTTCLGTVGYAAPEQFGGMGQTDARTDIYCLGATLYHLVTGKNPCEPPYEIKSICEINPTLSTGLDRIIQKCTQRDPNDRYQSAAELMYALEHYEEIDDLYRAKQKRKLGTFLGSVALTVLFGAASVWGYFSAEQRKSENYDEILSKAASVEDYYRAILTDPAQGKAYFALNDFQTEDYSLSKEEGLQILQLQAGLDQQASNGFVTTVNVLDQLRAASPETYEDVCFAYGWSFLSYYETDIDRDRYANAAKWFASVKDTSTPNGEIASIFYDISECCTKMNQLRGSKIIQTQALNEARSTLWEKVNNLKAKADGYSDDYKLQAWIEINRLIDENIADFLEIASPGDIIGVLESIRDNTGSIQGGSPDIQNLISELKVSTAKAIQRVESAKG